MKKSTKNFILLTAIFLSVNLQAFTMRPNMLFAAKLDGAQEVPAVSGTGIGVASFMLNAGRDSLCVNVTFTGLTGSVTGAHIHSGAANVNGPVVIDLMPFLSGNRITGIITGTALSTALKSTLLRGLNYINIHTEANTGGEIRGQIRLETDMTFVGIMNGSQAATTSTATGYAVFNVLQDESLVNFYVVTSGMSGPVFSAHIHVGAPGVSGGVIQDIQAFVNGNIIMGTFTPSTNVVAHLKNGNAYINLHTNAFIQGEVRGQLRRDNKIGFDAWLDGAQEVPAVTTTAKGVASFKLNSTLDSLWYYVHTDGLSGPITDAHIHNGSKGAAGPVAVGLNAATGNVVTGTITGSAITPALINNMLRGTTYINVHTAANLSGEIRGQIGKVMREGYTVSMDGTKQVPGLASGGSGSGLISINRDADHAHYMMVVDGVNSTGLEIRKAPAGSNGPLINDLGAAMLNNSVFGFWKTTDATPFTSIIANQIDQDSVYVNVPGTAHSGGEIRGQILSGFQCISSTILTGINDIKNYEKKFIIYPSPSNGVFIIDLFSGNTSNALVKIIDVLGKQVFSNEYPIVTGENNFVVSSPGLKPGIYFLKINSQDNELVKKLIIE